MKINNEKIKEKKRSKVQNILQKLILKNIYILLEQSKTLFQYILKNQKERKIRILKISQLYKRIIK